MRVPRELLRSLRTHGVKRAFGVPDSLLRPFTELLPSHGPRHTIMANEGSAVAAAAGYALATGDVPMVYMQNSGLGNAVNPLTSLVHPQVYGVPMLLLVGWRGAPGEADEPQHLAQGRVTADLLTCAGVKTETLEVGESPDDLVGRAVRRARLSSSPQAICIPAGSMPARGALPRVDRSHGLTRAATISCILDELPPDTRYVATTGYTGRELYAIRSSRGEPHDHDLLNVGAMGHASSIAYGIASCVGVPVVCIDGDGAALMHLGSWATLADASLPNLTHILFVNGAHESVGGQRLAARNVDFSGIGRGLGLREVRTARNKEELREALAPPMASLIVVDGVPGSLPGLGRPAEHPGQAGELFSIALQSVR